jgi:hypothetical protein
VSVCVDGGLRGRGAGGTSAVLLSFIRVRLTKTTHKHTLYVPGVVGGTISTWKAVCVATRWGGERVPHNSNCAREQLRKTRNSSSPSPQRLSITILNGMDPQKITLFVFYYLEYIYSG